VIRSAAPTVHTCLRQEKSRQPRWKPSRQSIRARDLQAGLDTCPPLCFRLMYHGGATSQLQRSFAMAKTERASRKAISKPENPASLPRTPSRARGKLRYEALLEATELLLNTEDPDSIGLYDIAKKANVPPASIYHFFPTKEASFLALAQHYVEGLSQALNEPIEAAAIRSWQDLAAIDMRRSADFHNAHVPMMKINYGGFGGVGTRDIDAMYVRTLASSVYARMNKVFHMPFMRNPEDIFEMRMAIIDAIYAISYRRHGKITDHYFREAHRAVVAFMSQVLPPRLELRESVIEAATKGEYMLLPYEIDDGGIERQ
jgi:AcrR family transcriptional regulator